MSYTLVLEWMPGDLYMSAVTARCTAPTSSYSVVWLPPNKVYQITLYCGSTSLVSFLVGAFRGKAWSYMKKEIFYLIGAGRCAAGVAGSTAGKRLYWKLSFGLWWDGHPELCTAYAERGNGLSDPGRCSSGTLRRGVSFPAQTVSNDFILECPGVQLYAGAFLIVLFGEFPSMCSVENFLPPLDKWIRQLYYSIVI